VTEGGPTQLGWRRLESESLDFGTGLDFGWARFTSKDWEAHDAEE